MTGWPLRSIAPLGALLLAACASVPQLPVDGLAPVQAPLLLDGVAYTAEWFVPAAPATALVTVQHGFARDCANVRETSRRIAARGLMTLCVNASMVAGNAALAEALALALTEGRAAPPGVPLPQKIVVGGHSAGALFASRLGWKLQALAPERLAGALLFDPVAGRGFGDNLAAVSAAGQRPVLAISANADGCNAEHNAYPALRDVRQRVREAGGDGFVGLQLTEGSTHVDVEGEDSSTLAILACGQPLPGNVEALRTLAAQWSADLAAGVRNNEYYPGGSYISSIAARPIE